MAMGGCSAYRPSSSLYRRN